MSALEFFFNLYHAILENANVNCKHNRLFPRNAFLVLDGNANVDITCKQDLTLFLLLHYCRTAEDSCLHRPSFRSWRKILSREEDRIARDLSASRACENSETLHIPF